MALAATPTVTPTATPTEPPPVDPDAEPTRIVAPTFSPVPVLHTATVAPTLAGLAVDYFTTDVPSVMPGENVTHYWSVRGADRAQNYRLDEEGERIWRWDVAAEDLTVARGTPIARQPAS